jgi:RNA polymerase sigma-70 factor (ECF subfamily)
MTRQTNISELTFEAIFRAYGKGLYAFLFRMSGNQHDAEDLTQETFVSVMRKLPTFKGESSVKTWIYSIAINKFRDSLRYGRIRSHDPLTGDEPAFSRSPLDDLVTKETGNKVKKAFYALAEHHRTAFSLVRFEGLTYKEAAQVLGTTLDTVRMRVHRAHLLLAEQLKEAQA